MKVTNLLKSFLPVLALMMSANAGAQTTAFSQDFTGSSTDPADYGFNVTGNASADMSATVTDGRLVLVAGKNGNSGGYDAKASFTEISKGNEVTLTCNWATGNATGHNTASYSQLVLSDGTNMALNIQYFGQPKTLYVNGTQVASANRDGNYEVSVTLNTNNQAITAIQIGSVYSSTDAIPFVSSDCKGISTFQFSHWARTSSWVNTSSVDNILITYTAVEEDPDYVEPIAAATIDGPGSMVFGPNPDTAEENVFKVTLIGQNGTSITEDNLNPLVTDFNVVWDIEGFKTANDTGDQYCDSYGSFSVNNQGKVGTTFDLKNVPMNFYGKMTATITYNGTTTVTEKYVVALGDLSASPSQLIPQPGYPTNFSSYPDALKDYQVTKDTYGGASDIILGGWCVAGSDSHTGLLLGDGDGTKYVRINALTAKKSHVITQKVNMPEAQVIFATKMRFNSAGVNITLTSKYPFWSSASGYTNPVTLSYDGTNITLNSTKLTNGDAEATFNTDTWYQVVLSVDKTNNSCYAQVYDTDGKLMGSTGNVAWTEESNPTFFSIALGNSNGSGSADIAACEAYLPTADTDKFTLTADKETLSIPNGETANLTATITDTHGYPMTQEATWSVLESDMQASITITPDEADSHKAVVSTTSSAQAGTATIQVNIGGYAQTLALTLTSSVESIKYTQSTASITIPLDENGTETATFAAIIADGSGNDMGRTVTLAAFNKEGNKEYTAGNFPTGISFDASTGVLTVTGAASPITLIIRATGLNSSNETLTKDVTVNIHGLKFDFGYADEASLAEGFTLVDASTTYNATTGYGIKSGTPTADGTQGSTNATNDYLSGAFEFDMKVQKGTFYTLSITYQGVLTTGYINSDLAGFELGRQSSMTTVEYTIPATTEIIDLHIANNGSTEARIAQVTVTKQPARTKRAKRRVHHIGDSTSANNGSWAYRLSKLIGENYSELNALCDFSNRGRGGRNLSTYYTEGHLYGVLQDIYPGDIVMFGNNGTNGMGNSFEANVNYYLDAAEALGAQIIINSYTPHGAVSNYASGYNSSTHTFNSYRKDSYETIVRKVAAEREKNDENYLGFVEIGKNADAAFNAYVADYTKNGYANANAAAQSIIACFTDHNHYANGTLACDLMLNGYGNVEGIVAQMVKILNSEATGINIPKNGKTLDAQNGTETIYNLNGQRIATTAKGLYIINGKKVIIK